MPRLTAIDNADLPPAFVDALERGLSTGVLSTTLPIRVWAHCPEAAAAWLQLLQVLQDTAQLSARERELARLKIASINQCQPCQLARKSDTVSEADIACLQGDVASFTERERLAVEFAEKLAVDHRELDDTFYIALQRCFTAAEIAELHMYCGVMLAGGKLTYALNAYPKSA